MAKTNKWIVNKILDIRLYWTAQGWGSIADAIVFNDKNYMLPNGGKWIKAPKKGNDYAWNEAPITIPPNGPKSMEVVYPDGDHRILVNN